MATIRPCRAGGRTVYRVDGVSIDFNYLSAAILYAMLDMGVDLVEVGA